MLALREHAELAQLDPGYYDVFATRPASNRRVIEIADGMLAKRKHGTGPVSAKQHRVPCSRFTSM
jgi:hypothetical protein